MRESRVWKRISANLPPYIEAERIEAMSPAGVSDVLWTDTRTSISGWLELKFCMSGDNAFRLGRIPKIKQEQPMFLRRQAEKNVPGGILLYVFPTNHWFFWRADPSHEWVKMIRSREAISKNDRHWEGPLLAVEVFSALGCPL